MSATDTTSMFCAESAKFIGENMSGSDGGIKTLANGLVICYLVVACTHAHTQSGTHTHTHISSACETQSKVKEGKSVKSKGQRSIQTELGPPPPPLPLSHYLFQLSWLLFSFPLLLLLHFLITLLKIQLVRVNTQLNERYTTCPEGNALSVQCRERH